MRYALALAALGTSLVVAFAGILIGAIACDESCYGEPGNWTTNAGAWQWDAIRLLAGGIALTACFFAAAIVGRRRRPALAFFGLQTALTAAMVGFVAVGNSLIDSAVPEAAALAFVPVLLEAAAVAALRARSRRASAP